MTADVLSEARDILRTVREAATPGPWTVFDMQAADTGTASADGQGWWWVWAENRKPYYGGILELDHGAIGEATITDNREPGRERADATLIVLLAGNPKLLDAIDGMLRAALDEIPRDDRYSPYEIRFVRHAEWIASEIVNGWKAMQG